MIRHLIAGIVLLAMLLAIFVGGAQPVAVGLISAPWDKLAHAILYASMVPLLRWGIGMPLLAALLLPLAVGAADEWHQLYLPGRDGSVDDWLADAVGIGLAGLALWWIEKTQTGAPNR